METDSKRIAETMLSEVLEREDLRNYVLSRPGITENIRASVLDWLPKARETLEKENPFAEETNFVERAKRLSSAQSAEGILRGASGLQDEYERISSVNASTRGNIERSLLNFSFYREAVRQQVENGKSKKRKKCEEAAERLDALQRGFIRDLEQNLADRKSKWSQNRFQELREKFLEELCEKIRNSMQLERLFAPLGNPSGGFAEVAGGMLSGVLGTENLIEYAASHEGFAANVQSDIAEWLKDARETLEEEDPFAEEAAFVERQKALSAMQIVNGVLRGASGIQAAYEQLSSVNEATRGDIDRSDVDFEFYRKELLPFAQGGEDIGKRAGEDSKERLEALHRSLLRDFERNLVDRRNKWRMARIDEMRKKFLEELYAKIRNFMRLESILKPIFGQMGALWGMSKSPFQTSGFEIIEAFAEMLERDESLRELADLIGRQGREEAKFEKELRDKTIVQHEWRVHRAYRGEIGGLRYSNDIAASLPNELALLSNPAAKKLFQLKFAQKQLLSLDYLNLEAVSKQVVEQEEVSVEKEEEEPKGPIIVCMDTSGSMQGTPENIAKTLTFALAKIAMEEKRRCYLISFSVGIEVFDMSGFRGAEALTKLVNFLKMSFNGGTDARPALEHAVEMLKESGYKKADVLMVSDFVMGGLPHDLVARMAAEKKKGTHFYSLVIGNSGNRETIGSFDRNWLYNLSNPHAQRHLVEQLHEIRTGNVRGSEPSGEDLV